ncbi:type I secretion system permease/ATPase [Devosia naphthalenivorans]|uniref:type I secretion system permease/ATPase n=1 Tax=Devosia naphthalenivorans TaxID=2082392 RepID=UPI000D36FE32|nr:type I secretion system permease/ATPase [Devosia naphthalenivorans]
MSQPDVFQRALGIYKKIIWSTLIFSAAINILLFVGPLYMLQIYDRVLQSRNETTLVMLTVIAGSMLMVHGLLEFLRSRVLVRTGYQFDEALSAPLFHRVLKASLANPGGNSQAALSDVGRLREFLTGSGLTAMCDVPWVPLFLIVCFLFHPWIGTVALGGATIVFVLALISELTTKKTLDEAQNVNQAAQQFASTTLQNAEVIRAMGMEGQLRDRWLERHDRMMDLQASASDRAGVISSISKFVRAGLQVAILGVGAYLVLQGEMSAGVMVAASIMMGRALAPVDQVVGQWKNFVGARQSYRRLKSMFAQIPADIERTALPAPDGRLVVEGLMALVPGSRTPVLQGVTFAIEPGQTLAVVGPSGAGKSSLVRTLVGVWPTVSGTVRLDGTEIGHYNSDELGAYVGYLPQEVELFAGTIAENIARFRDADDKDIVAAAKLAGVHDMIQKLPQGYDTEIGIGGRSLSGGQRQRVGLARALFGNPSLIVLDEPNANLDSEGETALMHALASIKQRATTVVFVSHKMNLLSQADMTLVMKDGRVQRFVPTRQFLQPMAAAAADPRPPQAAAQISA